MNGELRKNQDKSEDKHPDWKGTATVFGCEWSVGGWIRPTSDGRKRMKLIGTIPGQKWEGAIFRNEDTSKGCDYTGRIIGPSNIEIRGVNEKTQNGTVLQLRFIGEDIDVPF